MSKVTIYTTVVCPYCVRAKSLLKRKGVAFEEIDVSNDDAKRMEMVKKAGGRRTVPQIFVGDRYIGDADGILALEAQGKLDSLLKG